MPIRLLTLAAASVLSACDVPPATAPATANVSYSSTSTRLLECANMQPVSVSAVVGVEGAAFSFANNSVHIPAGALLEPVLLSLTIPSSRFAEVDVTANGLASFQFERPITITIDYSRCGRSDVSPDGVWYVDDVTHDLLEFMGGVNDPQHRRVTFTTSHLSAYALAD